MKKIILNYDEVSGNIYDGNGMFIFSYIGLVPVEDYEKPTEGLDKLTKVRSMGFGVEEMEKLNALGLL